MIRLLWIVLGFCFSIASFAEMQIEMFEQEWCAHCKAEKAYLQTLEASQGIKVNYRDLNDFESKKLFEGVTQINKLPKVAPLTFINWNVIQWFDKEATTGRKILEIIQKSKDNSISLEDYIKNPDKRKNLNIEKWTCDTSGNCPIPTNFVHVPFFWEVDIQRLWLTTSALVLGFVDGFNPCAMWVLVMFLTILVQLRDIKKMFQVAGIFILAESIMYYLILNVWFNVWDFVGLDNIVTPIVGIIATWSWLYFLYEWYIGDTSCKVWSLEQKRKTSKRVNELVSKPMTIAVFLGILMLAFSVNIIEFACSIWIPQTFTKILDINMLSFLERQYYMVLYIFTYMFDDFVVFGLALYSIEKIGITHKYTQFSHLIWGLLMLILWLILLINPWLLIL